MKEQADIVEGAVEATAQNSDKRYGVKIGGEWFDGQGKCPVAKGDQVKLAFASNGKSYKIVELRSNGQPKQQIGPEHLAKHMLAQPNGSGNGYAERRMARAVALKAAASATMSGDPATILRLAEKLEEWLYAAPSPIRGFILRCSPSDHSQQTSRPQASQSGRALDTSKSSGFMSMLACSSIGS